ncbi:hypothetical protein POVCU2_0050860 [Plasmodium ovale curtisi]|uniref:Uncharacterized protein n=1 Tax=Plasmodium ovale curtisi TaxID=864141 RepID=A0A1A8X035_PLAOA|nr:hypothetical protein POVCU2_0050860 [Plasmodium ovale curtisi]SBS98604.1 hypothetical protein POVCU1_047410 [Plasmodium ovale curtisi]
MGSNSKFLLWEVKRREKEDGAELKVRAARGDVAKCGEMKIQPNDLTSKLDDINRSANGEALAERYLRRKECTTKGNLFANQ